MRSLLLTLALLLLIPQAEAQTRIACGRSTAYTDSAGNVWQPDPLGTSNTYSVSHAIAGTPDQALYQNEQYAKTLTYKFTGLANGQYTVHLLLSENWWGGVAQRVFSETVQGQVAWPAIDIFVEAGGQFKALTKTVTVAVIDGTLTIALAAAVDNAKCDAIEILPLTVPPPPSWKIGLTAVYDDGTPLVGMFNVSQGTSTLFTLADAPFDATGFVQVTLTPLQDQPLTFHFSLLTPQGATIAQMTQTVDALFLTNLPNVLSPHIVIKKSTNTLMDFSLH
jgi:hypothetical protein